MVEPEPEAEKRQGIAEQRHDEHMATLGRLVQIAEAAVRPPPPPIPHDVALGPQYYTAGVHQLRRYTVPGILGHQPWLYGRLRKVPARAIEEESIDAEGPTALIECPCGARPIVNRWLVVCPGEGCERWYTSYGPGHTYVLYGDMKIPARKSPNPA